MIEKSLVVLKPDAVKRGIAGEIIHRFERAGLKIVGAKLICISRELASKHYNKDDEWKRKVGNLQLENAKTYGLDVIKLFGTNDPVSIGNMVNQANFDFMVSAPVFAFVFEGVNAVSKIRILVGGTHPFSAQPGTIRGDFGLDSPLTSMLRNRTIYNLIHASGTIDEAKDEIALWFKPEEMFSYKRIHEDLYSY